ncbi:MAG: 5-(carboxyamino)imidazole ribonucleotide synthase [Woeseiaceae bacterium]|nr:5-(carboxyamino)imidazole ribonucleotide synthase [Woeseiaceae bacterium]
MPIVAVVGAGQLGLMLGEAAAGLEVRCRFLDPAPDPPAAAAGEVIRHEFDDARGLDALVRGADVLTYEFENVPVASLRTLCDRLPVCPPPAALERAQDRLVEKRLFDALGIPTAPYCNVESATDVDAAAESLGLPLVFKTRRFGYDGKGQAVARTAAELESLWSTLGEVPLIAERFVPFEREVSIIGARSRNDDVAFWPLNENRHAGGILRVTLAPYEDGELFAEASAFLTRMFRELDYVGVLTLELFVADGRLVANEFAPRVHNSGHWTIEGATTSQFENHLRAVLGLELGDTAAQGYAAMINLIGRLPSAARNLTDPDVYFHDYGKSPREGRKLGHLTVVSESAETRDRRLFEIADRLSLPLGD